MAENFDIRKIVIPCYALIMTAFCLVATPDFWVTSLSAILRRANFYLPFFYPLFPVPPVPLSGIPWNLKCMLNNNQIY